MWRFGRSFNALARGAKLHGPGGGDSSRGAFSPQADALCWAGNRSSCREKVVSAIPQMPMFEIQQCEVWHYLMSFAPCSWETPLTRTRFYFSVEALGVRDLTETTANFTTFEKSLLEEKKRQKKRSRWQMTPNRDKTKRVKIQALQLQPGSGREQPDPTWPWTLQGCWPRKVNKDLWDAFAKKASGKTKGKLFTETKWNACRGRSFFRDSFLEIISYIK